MCVCMYNYVSVPELDELPCAFIPYVFHFLVQEVTREWYRRRIRFDLNNILHVDLLKRIL